jgi:hypothetical protein
MQEYFRWVFSHLVDLPLGTQLLKKFTVTLPLRTKMTVTDSCRKAVAHCAAKNENIEKFAIQCSVANENIQSTLVGTADVEQAINNVKWVEEYWAEGMKNKQVYEEVLQILEPVHNKLWKQGLPENDDL